ncbi:MAG: hypothetical protein M5U14_03610 [Acidimicrobiia bacterium]|nr:hypothetical protein [Acidimicrobiia bacterium]
MAARRFLLVFVLVSTAFVASSCGDDDGGGSAGRDGSVAASGGESGGDESGGDESGGDESGGDESGGGGLDDGCALVAQADAEALFGEPAEPSDDAGTSVQQFLVGSCIWQSPDGPEGELTPQHLLQFHVWDGEQFYGGDAGVYDDPEPIDVGDRGFIAVSDAGISLQFVQSGKTVSLDYSLLFADRSIASSAGAVQELAAKVSSLL